MATAPVGSEPVSAATDIRCVAVGVTLLDGPNAVNWPSAFMYAEVTLYATFANVETVDVAESDGVPMAVGGRMAGLEYLLYCPGGPAAPGTPACRDARAQAGVEPR